MERQRVNGAAKIDEFAVRRIRAAHREGMNAPDLAALFGLAAETVRRIIRRETWTWVEDHPPEPDEVIRASAERMLALQEDINRKKLPADTAKEILAELPAAEPVVKHFAEPSEERKEYLRGLGVKI